MEVCHIALSDLHMGEEDSILTPPLGEKESEHEEHWRPLGDFFESVISKNRSLPNLILMGDVVEFALSDPTDSQRLFFEFLRYLLLRRGLFGRVIYLPGNHDHHIWELSKEAQYISYVNRKGSIALKERPWNRTKAYVTKEHHFVTPYFWQGLMDDGVDIKVLYPNYFLGDEEAKLLIAFHHGHFLEPIYILLSRLKRLLFGEEIPSGIDTLEEENGPWIEFLFSSFGFSGEVGKRAETLYELMQSKRSMERFLSGLSSRLLGELGIRGPLNRLLDLPLSLFLRYLLRLVYRGHERKRPSELFSKELESSLQWYINYPLKAQLFEDKGLPPSFPFPYKRLAFLFGHTHKPFVRSSLPNAQWVSAYNLGSFVVDSYQRNLSYGLGIALLDGEGRIGVMIFRDHGPYEGEKGLQIEGEESLMRAIRERLNKGSLPGFLRWHSEERSRRAMEMRKRVLEGGCH